MKAYSEILQLERNSSTNVLSKSNDSDDRCNELERSHPPGLRAKEVTCPEPQGASSLADVCYRSCCRPRRSLPPHKGNLHNILNSFLVKDDLEYELDDNSSNLSLLSCSPPVRTNNPLVYDVKFVNQNLAKISPLGNCFGGTDSHSGVKISSCETSEERPTIRIEGFDSGKTYHKD